MRAWLTGSIGVALASALIPPSQAEPIVDPGTSFTGRLANSRLELPWVRYRLTMVGMSGPRSIGFRLLVLDDALPAVKEGADAKTQAAALEKVLQKGGSYVCVTTGAARDGLPLVRCSGSQGDLAAQLVAAGIGIARLRAATVLLPDGFDAASSSAAAPVRPRPKRRTR